MKQKLYEICDWKYARVNIDICKNQCDGYNTKCVQYHPIGKKRLMQDLVVKAEDKREMERIRRRHP